MPISDSATTDTRAEAPADALAHPRAEGRPDTDFEAVLRPLALPVDAHSIANAARALVVALPAPPLPGGGATLSRWRLFAALAGRDLSLIKIYEAHADALAILAELGALELAAHERLRARIWGVWAARGPAGPLRVTGRHGERVSLSGTQAWCSGAAFVTDALVTCVDADGRERLAALSLDQPEVVVSSRGWEAVGMQATGSVEVELADAQAVLVGAPGDYLARPGFWHGGAGVAACWYGAAAALAARLRDASVRRDAEAAAASEADGGTAQAPAKADARAHLRAHLGAADTALVGARATLREAARAIDAAPRADALRLALRTRAVVEAAVDTTLRACARGLGAAPLCRDRWFARMAADLPVFVRQSHAESDLATLGAVHATDPDDWSL